jgi:hypothetical protein
MHRIAIALCLAALTSGCGSSTMEGKFVEMKPYSHQQRRSAADIELYMEGEKPPRPVQIVGTVSTDWLWKGLSADQSTVFRIMRQTAAEHGLDGVMNIDCVPVGYEGEGLCSGAGFIYRQ